MQTRLVDLVLNLLRKAQYQGTTPSDDELYLITDDYGVTSADVINALGYTPYNASNPDGYLNTQTVGDATVNFVQDDATVGSLTTNQTQDSNITIRGLYDYYYLDLISVGTPTIINAIVSDFSTTNYVKMKTTYTMPSGWELWLNFTTAFVPSESDDNYQYLIGGDSANPDFAVYIDDYDKLTIQCGANTYTTSIELRSNATFNLRIIWNYDEVYGANPNGYCIELYDADMEYLTDEFINNATSPSTVNLFFGYSTGAAIGFKGSIDFGKTYINKIESSVPSLWWKPTTPLIDTKADVDGSNMVSSVKNFDGQWVHSKSYLISSTTSLDAQTSRSFDLSSYLPNDNYQYEVIVSVTGTTSTTSGQTFNTWFKSDIFTNTYSFVGTRVTTRTASSMTSGATVAIPVGTGRSIAIYNGSSAAGSITELWLSGYRRIGTNQ